MVDMGRALSSHVGGLPIKAMRGRAKVGVLRPSPGWVLIDPRMRHAVARVVVRRSHLCKKEVLFRTYWSQDLPGQGQEGPAKGRKYQVQQNLETATPRAELRPACQYSE